MNVAKLLQDSPSEDRSTNIRNIPPSPSTIPNGTAPANTTAKWPQQPHPSTLSGTRTHSSGQTTPTPTPMMAPGSTMASLSGIPSSSSSSPVALTRSAAPTPNALAMSASNVPIAASPSNRPVSNTSTPWGPASTSPSGSFDRPHHHHHQHFHPPHHHQQHQQQHLRSGSGMEWQERENRERERDRRNTISSLTSTSSPPSTSLTATTVTPSSNSLVGPGSALPSEEKQAQSAIPRSHSHSHSHGSTPIHSHPHTPGPGLNHRRLSGPDRDREDFLARERERPPYFPPRPSHAVREDPRDRERERERPTFGREDSRTRSSRDDLAFPGSRGLSRDQVPPRDRPQADGSNVQQGFESERILPPGLIGGGSGSSVVLPPVSVSRSPEIGLRDREREREAEREREIEVERAHRSGGPPGAGSPSIGYRDREREREPLQNPHPFLHPHAHTHSLHGYVQSQSKHGSSGNGGSTHPSHSHTHPHSHSHHGHPVSHSHSSHQHPHFHHPSHGPSSRAPPHPHTHTHGRRDIQTQSQSLGGPSGAPVSGLPAGSSEREKERQQSSPALSTSAGRDREREREGISADLTGPGPSPGSRGGKMTPIPMSILPTGGAPLLPPQASYQHRFHTQFVTSGMGGERGSSRPSTPRERDETQRRLSGGRDRERERDVFRERERDRRDDYSGDHYNARYPPPHMTHGYSPAPHHGHHPSHTHNIPPPPGPSHGMYPPPPPPAGGHPHGHGHPSLPTNSDMIVDPHHPPPLSLQSGPPGPPMTGHPGHGHGHLQYDVHPHPHPHPRAGPPPLPPTPTPGTGQQQLSPYGPIPVVPPGYHGPVSSLPPHGEYAPPPPPAHVPSSSSSVQQYGSGAHLHGQHVHGGGHHGGYMSAYGHMHRERDGREREREREREGETENMGHRHSQHQLPHVVHRHEGPEVGSVRVGASGAGEAGMHQPPHREDAWYAAGSEEMGQGYLHEKRERREKERGGEGVEREQERDRDRGRERDREREREREQEAQRIQQLGIATQRQQMQVYQHPHSHSHTPSGPGSGSLPHHHHQHQHQHPQRQQQETQQQPEENQPGAAPQSLQPHDGEYINLLEEEEVAVGVGSAVGTSTGGVGIPPSSATSAGGAGGFGEHMRKLSLPAYVSPSADAWDEEKNRARVKVDLGTWVYPNVPFPYFFDLGTGLVGMKEREEEKDRREKERMEREREFLEREKERKERKEREKREREERERLKKEREEGEIAEDEKETENQKEREQEKGKEEMRPQNNLGLPPQPVLPPPLIPDVVQPLVDMETRVSIIVPCGFIPTEKPLRPQLWGGGAFAPGRPPRPAQASSKSKFRHHRHVSSKGINALTGLHVLAGSRRARKTRRVYTDDSDVFLCAIHAGWITWSGAWKAKERGRDIRVDLRVIRVAGAGPNNIFARGVGGHHLREREMELRLPLSLYGGGDPEMAREEMIGRFSGGFGERCFNELGKLGRMVGEEDEEDEDFGWDDPEDDGRSLVSGGWGTGHDGSAIEIVNVHFLERGTAHKGPGLGRRNRSQRLLEYAERRAAVLATPSVRLAGRKRPRSRPRHCVPPFGRRPWDSNWPTQPRRTPRPYYNKSVLDVVYEEDEAEDEVEMRQRAEVEERERKMMDARTVVIGCGTMEMKVGYKYVPSLIEDLLFPSAEPTTTNRPSTSGGQPPKKRRRVVQERSELEGGTEDAEMEDGTQPKTPLEEEVWLGKRPLILETAKESYLLSPSTPREEGDTRQMYDIALILEAEVVVEEVDLVGVEREGDVRDKTPVPVAVTPTLAVLEQNSKDGQSQSVAASDVDRDESPVPTRTPQRQLPLTATTSPVHSPEPSDAISDTPNSRADASLIPEDVPDPVAGSLKSSAGDFTLQVLQGNLLKEMFRFEREGVYVLDADNGGGSSGGGMETEWVIQVKSWKWAPGMS